MAERDGIETIQAVVLTFQAPDAVRRCVSAILGQSHPVDEIVVVDNDGGTAAAGIPRDDPRVRVLALPTNLGPAGGYAAGLADFLTGTASCAWLMDDDCEPAPDALARQLDALRAGAHVVLATMVDDQTRLVTNTHGWCAVLLQREVVKTVGLPNAELFWWTEDTEYLQWRIPRRRFHVVRDPDAIVHVSRSRDDTEKPAWKYYYEARNQTYYRLHTQRVAMPRPRPRHLRLRVRSWRALRSVVRLTARVFTRESRDRGAKLAMIGRGTWDGIRGRLGITVIADQSDRPLIAGGA